MTIPHIYIYSFIAGAVPFAILFGYDPVMRMWHNWRRDRKSNYND